MLHDSRCLAGSTLLAALSLTGCLGAITERAPGDHGMWMGGPPILGDLDGDGIEDLFASGVDGTVALRGSDYELLWSRTDREIDVHDARRLAVIAGGAVVLAHGRALEVLEPTTGATRASVPVTDQISWLCPDGGKVSVYQIDDVTWVLDVATGERDDAATPVKCPAMANRPVLCDTATHARCEGDLATKKARLTDPTNGDSVAVELKDPGTPEVTLIGHDRDGQPTWRLPFDPSGARIEALDLVGGTLLIRQGRTTAIDAHTGAVVWTSTCGGSSGHAMIGTADRVYYECDGPKSYVALRIVDRATGAVLKDFGTPRGG